MSAQEEEQAMEAEALEAIMADDLEVVSDAAPRQYRIKVVPYPSGEGDNHGEDHSIIHFCSSCQPQVATLSHSLLLLTSVGIRISFTLPPSYPEVQPEVSALGEKGLSAKQLEELERYIDEKVRQHSPSPIDPIKQYAIVLIWFDNLFFQALENIGMAMIYTLVEAAREWLIDHNVPSQVRILSTQYL